MKAPDHESGINNDFTEKSTDWIATAGKRCTDAICLTYHFSPGSRGVRFFSGAERCYLHVVVLLTFRFLKRRPPAILAVVAE